MPPVTYLTHKRRIRQAARQSTTKAGTGCALTTGLFLLLVAFTSVYLYIRVTTGLPSIAGLPVLFEPPAGRLLTPTQIYDRSGNQLLLSLKNPMAAGSQYLPARPEASKPISIATNSAGNSLPSSLILATIASTDPSFWENSGFTYDFQTGKAASIAERLVSEFLLPDEAPGLLHTLRIKLLAAQVTSQFGKSKILEWYLNSVRYGDLIFGADAAARAYFHKPTSELNLAEAAALAALAEMPMENPATNSQKVLERQRSILQALLNQELVPSLLVKNTLLESVHFYPAVFQPESFAPAFTNLVLQQVEQYVKREDLERGGYIIRTSLDYDLQKQVDCTSREQLRRIRNEMTGETSNCSAARLLPTLPVSNWGAVTNDGVEIAVLDAASGQVLALTSQSNLGENPGLGMHEPGALLAPLIDLTAFTRGLSPATLAWDIPSSLPADLQNSTKENKFHGPVRLRTALANGYFAPAVQLLSQLGPDTVAKTAQQLGLDTIDASTLEHMMHQAPFLSGGEVSALQIGQAYSVFATMGNLSGQSTRQGQVDNLAPQLIPVTIQSIRTKDENVVFDCGDHPVNCRWQTRPVVSSQLAYLVTDMLSDEAARWPSLGHPNSLEIGRPAGALLSRSGEAGAWAVGYTPQLVTSVWVSAQTEANTPIDLSSTSAALWHAVMQHASQDQPSTGWTAPQGIVTIPVCDPSGMLPTPECPTVVNEVFATGNEPLYPDTLYKSFSVNRETGKLATVFTPPESVEEKVFLVVPPGAETWAQQTGLPRPPSDYDVIVASPPASPDLQITSPVLFAAVKQKVSLRGTAAGENFQYYRLQAGQGLNPQKWIQIGQDQHTSVKDGFLGEWDTTGLSGLYALQLQVIYKDQRMETVTVQVTVDNQAPEIQVLRPLDGQSFPASSSNAVILETQAKDEIGIAKVEYYIDRQLAASLTTPPYTLSWGGTAGEHRLTVRAYDLAGNQSEKSIQFKIQK